MVEPLKNKKECFSTLCYRDKGVKCNHSFHEKDIRSAVVWLKKEHTKLWLKAKKEDWRYTLWCRKEFQKKIDLAFEDVTKKGG